MGFFLIHRDDRIKQYREIRSTVVFAMCRDSRSQMATCREAHDTHIVGIDMPHCCTVANHADGLLCIAHGYRAIAMGHTVGQHKEGNALIVEPLGPVLPFVLH